MSITRLCCALLFLIPAVSHGEWRNALQPVGTEAIELTLPSDGKSEYVVVIPQKATNQERKAAAELVMWIHRMTGARLPVVLDSQDPIETEIVIGNTNRIGQEDNADLGAEGYAIDVQGKRLLLTGGTMRGPIYAVYALLEEDLGCRWYHKDAVEIPTAKTLRFRPVVRSFVPPLYLRDPFYVEAFDRDWSLRNRTNSSRMQEDAEYYATSDAPAVPPIFGGRPVYVPGFVHTYWMILPPGEFFESHPEYFSEIDEKRTIDQICMTNPEALEIVIDRVLKVLESRPDATTLEISQNDSLAYCQCSECSKLTQANNSPAGPQIHFVNKIAEAVAKKYPHIRVSTLAYLSTLDAPTSIIPRDNVTIRLCNDRAGWRFPLSDFINNDLPQSKQYRDAIVAWSKISKNLTIWDYTVNFSHYLAPMPNMHTLKPNLDFYAAHNVRGMMYQGAFQSVGGERARLRSWVMAKLLWDPSRNTDDLIQDFVWGYYKEAAPAILEYYALLDRARAEHLSYYENSSNDSPGIRYDMSHGLFTADFLKDASEIFERALQLSINDEVRQRVEQEELAILYVKLMQGPKVTGSEYSEVLKRFEEIARQIGVDYVSDTGGGPDFETTLQTWRDAARPKK
jgi:hypothetical protein